MKPYIANIENEVMDNDNFRKVLHTGKFAQLVVMSLEPGEEIGEEVHDHIDQFFRIEAGAVKFVINDQETITGPDFVVIIPAGVKHNVINISAVEKAKLYTIYSPAEHKDGTIHITKADAEKHHS